MSQVQGDVLLGAQQHSGRSGELEPQIRAGDVMHAPVHTLEADWSVDRARTLLLDRSIGAAPVVDASGRVVGIISKTDLLRHAGGDPERGVSEVMTRDVISIFEDADVVRAAALMAYEGVHRLVVVSADNRPVGIVSSIDILRCIARNHGYVVPDLTRPQVD